MAAELIQKRPLLTTENKSLPILEDRNWVITPTCITPGYQQNGTSDPLVKSFIIKNALAVQFRHKMSNLSEAL